ncbi:MAG TPA: (5-formylfuran-3-yl)methyl phosphate synthase [Anaerolineales bacterium]|nr:(5-formylfuran-3-yl)methyl phosphate synthase [Anaerolineales bacterium]
MRLMISVVSSEEAQEALDGGAEILDVKNPVEGSLGAQVPGVIRAITELAGGRVQVSAAIGDLPNLPGTAALAALGAAMCGADFVKVGLQGPRTSAEAVAVLGAVKDALQGLPTVVIAGAYADFERAGTLDPKDLPGIAAAAGVGGCLIDTAIKDGKSLFDFLKPEEVGELAVEAHAAGLLFAVAGTLGEKDLAIVQRLGADVVGLRTAVCQDNRRTGRLDAEQVRRLVAAIKQPLQEKG